MQEQDDERAIAKVKTYRMRRYSPSSCLESLTHPIIRPPRFIYNPAILDPRRIYRGRYTHTVHHIPFPLSLYTPAHMKYVLLYLHGNSSSRYQGFLQLTNLPTDVGLACFDFNGCGIRTEAAYVSLGKHQAADVDLAAKFLKQQGHQVIGWGRSMGAVSLLLSNELDVIAVDSPFSSLHRLVKELGKTQMPCCCLTPFYHCLIPFIWCAATRQITRKTGMHPDELEIIDSINTRPDRSILFLAGQQDEMVASSHAQALYEAYLGRKKLILFEGDHNSTRPSDVMIGSFLWLEGELERWGREEEEEVANQYGSGSWSGVESSEIRVGSGERRTRESINLLVRAKTES